jgi:dolichol-phosphate mannosyltransferase
LLEIAVRQHPLRTAEMPFVFGTRLADDSKASAAEGLRFLRHLGRLRLRVLRDQAARSSVTSRRERLLRIIAFGLVGASGLAVNSGALWLLTQQWHHHYLLGAVLATEASTLWNFALTEALVFRGAKPGSLPGRGVRFAMLNHVALLLRLPLLALLVEVFGVGVLLGNLVTLVLMFAVRFVVADAAIYALPAEDASAGDGTPGPAKDPMRVVVHTAAVHPRPATVLARPGSGYLPYRYAIDGIVTVGSQVPLKELEYFRAQWLGNDVDLAIRVDTVGHSMPRGRATMTQYMSPPALTYQEHLGRLGANFRVDIGDPVRVTCSPTLAKSPHVLYTNLI